MEEMAMEALVENLKESLGEKEFGIFVKFYLQDKDYSQIIKEMEISKKYAYSLKARAKKIIEEKYELSKIIKKLKNEDISENIANISHKKESESTDNEPTEQIEKEDVSEVEGEENKGAKKKLGVFVAFDDAENAEQIKQLITMIDGVSHISEKSHEVEELKQEVASILDNY